MERLTLACMAHLPSSVLFVMDLTGQCGTSMAAQWEIRQDLKRAFPAKPWLDVFTKADLLEELKQQVALAQARERCDAQQPHLDNSLASAPADERDTTTDGPSSSQGPSLLKAAQIEAAAPSSGNSAGGKSSQSHSMGSVSDTDQQQHPSDAAGSPFGSKDGQRTRFKWGDRADNNIEKALEVALALPQALWVSSLTEHGLDDLKSSVLQLLAD